MEFPQLWVNMRSVASTLDEEDLVLDTDDLMLVIPLALRARSLSARTRLPSSKTESLESIFRVPYCTETKTKRGIRFG